jgi:hypothetical protein
MSDKQFLEVGDVLYRSSSHGYGLNKYKVIRVTNTQAIIEYHNTTKKLTRQLKPIGNYLTCNAIGKYNSWEPNTYRLENEELKTRFANIELTNKTKGLLERIDCSKLTQEQLQNLHDFLLTLKQNETVK